LPGRRRIAAARLPGKAPCLGGSALERRVRLRSRPVAPGKTLETGARCRSSNLRRGSRTRCERRAPPVKQARGEMPRDLIRCSVANGELSIALRWLFARRASSATATAGCQWEVLNAAGVGARLRRTAFMRSLTFELSGRHRQGAWPAQRMMTLAVARAKRLAGGGPLERRVRHHLPSPMHARSTALQRPPASRHLS
jgi:hypothetical protein